MEFIQKVIRVQMELKAPKDNYNDFGKYRYRSAEGILEAVKPILDNYGLLLNLSDEVVVKEGWHYTIASATITDGKDSITVTANAREEETKKGMDASQISGVASSYARKYALNGLFLIDDTKDADTDEFHIQTTNNGEKDNLGLKRVKLQSLMNEETWESLIEKQGEPWRWTEKQIDRWIAKLEGEENA
jgi:hypothetical protein